MTQKITTNELEVTFDYEAIRKNYRFYQLETSEKFIKSGAAFLDLVYIFQPSSYRLIPTSSDFFIKLNQYSAISHGNLLGSRTLFPP